MKTELRCQNEECQGEGQTFPHKLWDYEQGARGKEDCPGPGLEVEIPYADYDYSELAAKIDSEGFGYFFDGYASLSEFHDGVLAELVEDYKGASRRLRSYLEAKGGLL